MTIHVTWYNQSHTIMLQTFEPGWTWEEFDRAHDETFALISSVRHAAAFITDLSRAPTPPTPNAIGHLQRIRRLIPDNAACIVVVGPGPFMKQIGDIFLSVMGSFRRMVSFASDLPEAERIISGKLGEKAA